MNKIEVILVDNKDNAIGVIEKMEAHQKALLHRAVSVFILTTKGEWILQRRALTKYHSPGLWTNTCCTHPMPNESNHDAAQRRLMEEMGYNTTIQFTELFSFIYKEELDNNLTEFEFDHVFVGFSDEIPTLNADEVCEYKSILFSNLQIDILENPTNYTVWFRKIYEKVQECLSHKIAEHSYFDAGFIL